MFGRTKEFRQLICLWADKDPLTTVGKTKSRIDASDRFTFYRQFKTNHVQEAHLSVDINNYVKNTLVKFRFGISSIAVHSLRYKLHILCVLCVQLLLKMKYTSPSAVLL